MSIIKKIAVYFSSLPVRRAYIFGSYARKENTRKSDIDILIDIDYSNKVSLLDFIGWKIDLEKLLNKKVDLVAEDGLSPHIRPYIEREKKMIYEKG